MEKQRNNRYAHVSQQVDKMRRLYSQIGEPLPVDVMIGLYQHLEGAMEIYRQEKMPCPRPKKKKKAFH